MDFILFLRAAIFIFGLILSGAAFADDAKNRVALVIGNAAYKRSALANPVNDAKLMAEKLEAQGFEVFASYDAGQRDMKRAVQNFAATLRERGKGVAAFIFYAGHGVKVKGENYLIPTFTSHTDYVTSVAISPDGRAALPGSPDTTLRLWDISEWTQPQEARR